MKATSLLVGLILATSAMGETIGPSAAVATSRRERRQEAGDVPDDAQRYYLAGIARAECRDEGRAGECDAGSDEQWIDARNLWKQATDAYPHREAWETSMRRGTTLLLLPSVSRRKSDSCGGTH
jgi:hypothetical protein